MSLLSAIAGRLPRASAARRGIVIAAALLALAACADRGREDHAPEPRAEAATDVASTQGAGEPAPAVDAGVLAPLLERARTTPRLSDADRSALEQAMQAVLEPAAGACDRCSAKVSYVDEPGGGDHFRCDVVGQAGERMAELEVYHRPDLPPEAARGWARSTVAGHPASELRGEHLFLWAGPFEIRVFGRAASLRGEGALERLVARLPLDTLAKS